MALPAAWWNPHVHADRRPALLARARLLKAVRSYFDGKGFVEVETGGLAASPGNEAHLHAFATELVGPGGERAPLYLHTSPEFAMKKLLAAGERRIFDVARVFRNRERGALHHPAFTLVEWYRAGEPIEAPMADCTAMLRFATEAAGATVLRFRGRASDPFAEPTRITVAHAFARFAGIDLLATIAADGATDRAALAGAATAAGIRVAADDTWGDVFSRILVERVEPRLGDGVPTFLCDYPAAQAALARPKPGDPRHAERFELYACGVELANGIGELTDPALQRRRLDAEMDEKVRVYGERYPLDEDFLAALAQMPPASGCALGLDRLVMLATGAPDIARVIWAPVPDPFEDM
jgi:lysyl-tRNA synthetase class 2